MKIRIHKTENFTVMSNHHLRDKGLSWKARGLLSVMLSLPDGWEYTIDGLAALSIRDGRHAVMTGLRELEQASYIKRGRERAADGRLRGTLYDVYEVPFDSADSEKKDVKRLEIQPKLDLPKLDLPKLENHTLDFNKEEINKEEINKDLNLFIYNALFALNRRLNTNFRAAKNAVKALTQLFESGYTLEQVQTVIDRKADEWQSTPMAVYLRPETLFGDKFDSYLNAVAATPKPASASGTDGAAERAKWYSDRRQAAERKADAAVKKAESVPAYVKAVKELARFNFEIARAEVSGASEEAISRTRKMKAQAEQTRAWALRQIGLASVDLKPRWHCPKCEDTGWETGTGRPCDCFKNQ